jgi:hypothetical protein
MEIGPFASWPHKWFGYWSEYGQAFGRCPSIDEFVDPGWRYDNRAGLAAYLANAPVVATTSRFAFPWLRGKGDGRMWVSVRADGEWAWLDDLAYYVAEQGVRLPDSLVAAIEARAFRPPTVEELAGVDLRNHPSPPVD